MLKIESSVLVKQDITIPKDFFVNGLEKEELQTKKYRGLLATRK